MKKLLSILLLLTIMLSLLGNIYAAQLGTGYDETIVNNPSTNKVAESYRAVGYRILSIVSTIFQVLSVLGIVLAGTRYMLAGASAKADMKKSLISILIGCFIIFGASSLVRILESTFEKVLQ